MSLMNELKAIQEEMTALLGRLGELQQKVDSLENQNLKLLERITEENAMNDGDENLMSLYNEGYHICPQDFGKKREDPCLLCMAFIEKQKNNDD